jgi:hypothetical protein
MFNADHLHYYIMSNGKYTRKLITEEDWTLLLLAGCKFASNHGSPDGIYTVEDIPPARPAYQRQHAWRRRVEFKVHFPYMVILADKAFEGWKFRAIRYNKCPKCPRLIDPSKMVSSND